MREIKIVAPVPFWKRAEVSCIFWENIKRLREEGLDIEVVAVVSDQVNAQIAKQHTKHVISFPNDVVGLKWNKGVDYCRGLDFTHLLIVGSDDIFTSELIDRYIKKDAEYVGLLDATAISLYNQCARHFTGYTSGHRRGESVGSGRMITKDVIERLDYNLFANKNFSLDYSMTKKLKGIGVECTLIKTGLSPIRLGLKTSQSIGGMFGSFNNRFSRELLEQHYGTTITDMIFNFDGDSY